MKQFTNQLQNLQIGMNGQQLSQLINSIDVDGDGTIDYNEFKQRFEVVFQQADLSGEIKSTDHKINNINDDSPMDISSSVSSTSLISQDLKVRRGTRSGKRRRTVSGAHPANLFSSMSLHESKLNDR